MKPITEAPLQAPHESFSIKIKNQVLFDPFLHKHDTYELTFIPKVRALRFIGDSVKEINENELVLLAPNLLHCWHIFASEVLEIPAVVTHFKEDFLGQSFFEKPELRDFRHILEYSGRGIKFSQRQQELLLPAINTMLHYQGMKRLIQLLSVFELIGSLDYNEFQFIASSNYRAVSNESDYQHIGLIFNFVKQNFNAQIKLQDVADLSNLSTSAFCRYFKKCTGKTFMDYVKEIRISHACHLLQYKKYTITEVSFRCGYNNMANFNRQFRQITMRSPKEYQQLYQFDPIRHLSK